MTESTPAKLSSNGVRATILSCLFFAGFGALIPHLPTWLDAAQGDADYGKELDLQLSYNLNAQHAVLLKYADYQANSLHTDTSKFWLQWLAKY